MWRALVVIVVVGCGDPAPATPDAAADAANDAAVVMRTSPFSPQLCTSGSPGAPTCPVNHVALDELGALAAGTKLEFTASPLSQDLYLDGLRIDGGNLHITGLFLDFFANGMWTMGPLLAESLDENTSVTAAAVSFPANSQLGFRVEAIY